MSFVIYTKKLDGVGDRREEAAWKSVGRVGNFSTTGRKLGNEIIWKNTLHGPGEARILEAMKQAGVLATEQEFLAAQVIE